MLDIAVVILVITALLAYANQRFMKLQMTIGVSARFSVSGCTTLLRTVDNYKVETLLTLAAVLGGYTLAHHLHASGPSRWSPPVS